LIFILLAAGVSVRDLQQLGWQGVAVVGLLMVVIRPLGVLLSAHGSGLAAKERVFLAAVAPRGIVAAAIASITAVSLEAHGFAGGRELRALVFLTISGTVIGAGLLAPLLARLLDLRLPARDTVAILGAQELGLLLGGTLARQGVPVLMLDSNERYCAQAAALGLPAVCGNALDRSTLEGSGLERVGTAVAVTANETLNALFTRRTRLVLGVRNSYVALSGSGITADIAAQMEARQLFEAAHEVDRWNLRARRADVIVEEFEIETARPREPGDAALETSIVLTLRRGKRVWVMSPDLEPQPGDVASVAIHRPEREVAHERLVKWGWKPVQTGAAS
jgi:Trk K+ transport system NAD-binding subunit